jgi:hypothetical protein
LVAGVSPETGNGPAEAAWASIPQRYRQATG